MCLTQGLRRGARTTPDDACLISGARQWSRAETQDRVARLEPQHVERAGEPLELFEIYAPSGERIDFVVDEE